MTAQTESFHRALPTSLNMLPRPLTWLSLTICERRLSTLRRFSNEVYRAANDCKIVINSKLPASWWYVEAHWLVSNCLHSSWCLLRWFMQMRESIPSKLCKRYFPPAYHFRRWFMQKRESCDVLQYVRTVLYVRTVSYIRTMTIFDMHIYRALM